MDRIEAIKVFVAALDEGSLAAAARRLGRSPAAVSRAMSFLEERVGAPLLHRTTRGIRLSEAGERYAVACRRVLSDLEEAELIAAGARAIPRGTLTVTAPTPSGEAIFRPVIDEFLDSTPTVHVNLLLIDRQINLIEEGIDIALRIAHLPDSTLIASKVGEVRCILVASPKYLSAHPAINKPTDLAEHHIIAMSHFGTNSWSFPEASKSSLPRTVNFIPRLTVNTIGAAVASVMEGRGITRLLSYQVAEQVRSGALQLVLERDEPQPRPVHLITPKGQIELPKVRAFFDFAAPRLKWRLQQLTLPGANGFA